MLEKTLHIYHPVHFEEWDFETPDKRGIGNSETAQIELAWRFAERGWKVFSYAPVPWTGEREWRGTTWMPLEDADFSAPGYWMIFRHPPTLDKFTGDRSRQMLTVVSQDESYGSWNDERVAKLDKLFALCGAHRESLRADHPGLYEKTVVSSNGIKMGLIRQLDEDMNPPIAKILPRYGVERNPHRIMWASSPDRGLLNLLKIFRRVREWVSDAELYIAYGFNNIDKLISMGPEYASFARAKEQILREANQPGVYWLGRVSQPELLREWAKTGLLVYPTTFRETSCATIMEAQAMGAIPVVSPVWALWENLCEGTIVDGDPNDDLVRGWFVGEAYRLMATPGLQDQIRPLMMEQARFRFNWERQIDKYEAHLLGYHNDQRMVIGQFNFQLKQALQAPLRGDSRAILNVGCADDPARLAELGAVNVDAREADPIFGRKTAAHYYADVRTMEPDDRRYDCIILGDMLEHFKPEVVPGILRRMKQFLAPEGRIVFTVPDDHRRPEAQHSLSDGSHEYLDGVSAVHLYPIPADMIWLWLHKAGLRIVDYQKSDCGHYFNHGVAAVDARPVCTSLDQIDCILKEASLEEAHS